MSKNTGTSELINYFDLLSAGAVSIAGTIYANDGVQLSQVGTALPTNLKNVSGSGIVSFGSNFLGFNGSNNLYFSGDNKGYCEFAFNNAGGGRTYTFPSSSGTIALVGGSGVGTVTSVAALTLGTSGTDLSSTVANGTTTPVITLNVPTASATNRGALSAADWNTFNNKQNALTNPVTGTGTSGQVAYFIGTSAISSESNLFWDATNDRLGIGINTPSTQLNVGHDFHGLGLSYLGSSSLPLLAGIYTSDGTAGGQTGYGSLLIKARTDFGGFYSINFFTSSSNNSPQERMRIFSDGNTFIGSSPSNAGFKLDVNGTGRFSGNLSVGSGSGAVSLAINRGATGDGNGLRFQTAGTNNWYIGSAATSTNTDLEIYNHNTATTNLRLSYSTGEATFSSSVTTLGSVDITGAGNTLTLRKSNNVPILALIGATSNTLIEGGNTFNLYTGGTGNRIFVTALGNVGIGTASPVNIGGYTALTLNNSTTGGILTFQQNGVNKGSIYNGDSSNMYFGNNSGNTVFETGGSPRMTITSGGNVGIGTTGGINVVSGWTNFVVNGSTTGLIGVKANEVDYGAMYASTGGNNFVIQAYGSSNAGNMLFLTASSVRLTINSTGFVSAGEVTNARLGVRGFTNDSIGYAFEAANASGNTLFIVRNDGVSAFYGVVGINTLSPNQFYKLTLAGDGSTNTGGIVFRQNSTDTFYIGNPTVTNTTDFEFWNPRNGYTRFATNNTERMRIARNGEIGFNSNGIEGDAGLGKISIGHSGTYGWIQTWSLTPMYLNRVGNAVYAGTQRIDNNSDERIKENIESISNALNIILSLQGRKFNMLDENGKLRYGFVAQEVQEHLLDFVTESDRAFEKDNIKIEKLLTLESSGSAWAALLVEAIKEQQKQIEELKNKLS
jgi:hypothetical protein